MRGVLLLVVLFAGPARAQSVAALAAQPTDAVSLQAFALNPALPLAAGVWTLGVGLEPQRKVEGVDADGVSTASLTRTRWSFRRPAPTPIRAPPSRARSGRRHCR